MSLNNFNKASAIPEESEEQASGSSTEALTELEKMAARELQQKIDEGKRTWKLQSQFTSMWQRYMEDTEQVIRRKVERIRNTVRGMEKGQRFDRRFSAPASSVPGSSVHYYPAVDNGEKRVLLAAARFDLGEWRAKDFPMSYDFNGGKVEKKGKVEKGDRYLN